MTNWTESWWAKRLIEEWDYHNKPHKHCYYDEAPDSNDDCPSMYKDLFEWLSANGFPVNNSNAQIIGRNVWQPSWVELGRLQDEASAYDRLLNDIGPGDDILVDTPDDAQPYGDAYEWTPVPEQARVKVKDYQDDLRGIDERLDRLEEMVGHILDSLELLMTWAEKQEKKTTPMLYATAPVETNPSIVYSSSFEITDKGRRTLKNHDLRDELEGSALAAELDSLAD